MCPPQPKPVVVELHWQDRGDPDRTVLVARGAFREWAAFEDWVNRLIDARGQECPDGWGPTVLHREPDG